MKVNLAFSLFQAGNYDEVEWAYLFRLISYGGRYELTVTDPNVVQTEIYAKMPPIDQELISMAVMGSAIGAGDFDCEVCQDGEKFKKEKKFTISEAIRYLSQPASIVVENSLNDSHFICSLLKCLGERELFEKALNSQWLQFENSGGCSNVINFFEGRLQFFQQKPKFLRCVVILDSDRRFPTDSIAKYRKAEEYFVGNLIDYHILEKRMMENYLPDEALKSIPGKQYRVWVNAYLSLSAEQRDFIDMNKGLSCDYENSKYDERTRKRMKKKLSSEEYGKRLLPQSMRSLYANVLGRNFEILEHGMQLPNMKTTFPKLFDREELVFRKSLLRRTAHQNNSNELTEIVGKIRNII